MNNSSPFSLTAMMNFLSNYAGLLFIAAAVFVVGFWGGSTYTENAMLKKGMTTAAAAPAAADAGAAAAPAAPMADDEWAKIEDGAAGIIGNRNAKLTMVEFTDYQCPFCGQHYNTTMPDLMKNYVDTGKMKIVYRDQPLPFHPNARIGALAARCAGDQGGVLGNAKDKNFKAMHDSLFGKQSEWVDLAKDAAIDKFGEYATAAGMNANTLKDCVKTEKFGKQVDTDIALAGKVGANGTPTFFINKVQLVGAQPFSAFQTEIDKNL